MTTRSFLVPRRSALSPRDDEELDDAVVGRRSALSPLPLDEQPATAARRSAFTPSEPDDDPAPRRSAWVDEDDDEDEDDGYEETLRLPLPRRSSEYATAARAIQPALPDLGPTPESLESPVEEFSPDEPPSPVTDAVSPFSPSVQPTLPDPVLSGPNEAEFAITELPQVTVPEATMAAAAVAAEVLSMPDLAELPAAVAEKQELLAGERDMVSEGAPAVEEDSSTGRRRHGHVAVRLGVLRCRPLALQAPSPRRARDRGRPDPDRHRRPGVRRAQGHLAEGEVDTEAQPHHPYEAEPRHVRASCSRRVARPQEAAHSFLGRLGPVARR